MTRKKILVADDDEGIVEAMQMLLEEQGYQVAITRDAVNISRLIEDKPDMIFLDIWMSGVDGRDVCTRLKQNPDTTGIPVVMFSANKDTREIAMQCGANDFLAKPFEIRDLLKMAEKYTSSGYYSVL